MVRAPCFFDFSLGTVGRWIVRSVRGRVERFAVRSTKAGLSRPERSSLLRLDPTSSRGEPHNRTRRRDPDRALLNFDTDRKRWGSFGPTIQLDRSSSPPRLGHALGLVPEIAHTAPLSGSM